ncbi:integrator complex subunit 5-like protein [Drosophila mojavensis]|uniref:DUF4794 domain-containing protein n=1 Tax=Drosophila mojavensis TaxID=7230 RepID=B4KVX3_DROMO|nr:integrator complex subunit 5-like protein [Drosophila mojavensis]EDW19524.2 uncharacterized protein Dmoj_GI11480 [Drosophila mojavensis]
MWQTERISSSGSLKAYQCFVVSLMALRLASAQYASPTYNGHSLNNNIQLQLQRLGYPDAPLTYSRTYSAPVQSRWSGAPIVVNDEANILQQQERQYLPINYYNNREDYATVKPDSTNPNWFNNNNNNNLPTTRAVNHNYNNNDNNDNNYGAYYYTQPPGQQELDQRELLTVADTRRPEDQIVRIGGSRSLAYNNNNNIYRNNENYYEAALLLGQREFQAKYAKHYADYLRKYPRRLQPQYFNTFIDK